MDDKQIELTLSSMLATLTDIEQAQAAESKPASKDILENRKGSISVEESKKIEKITQIVVKTANKAKPQENKITSPIPVVASKDKQPVSKPIDLTPFTVKEDKTVDNSTHTTTNVTNVTNVENKQDVAVKEVKTKPVKQKLNVEDETTKYKLFTKIFIDAWKKEIVQPVKDTKISTIVAKNENKQSQQNNIVASKPPKDEGPSKFAAMAAMAGAALTGLFAAGEKLGEFLAEKVTEMNEQVQSASNTIRSKAAATEVWLGQRHKELASKNNITLEDLDKEKQILVKQYANELEALRLMKKEADQNWVPDVDMFGLFDSSLDAASEAVRTYESNLKNLQHKIDGFDDKIKRLRIEQNKPVHDIPKSSPVKLPKLANDIPSVTHQANAWAAMGGTSRFNGHTSDNITVSPEINLNVPNTVIDFSGLDSMHKQLAAMSGYMQKMVEVGQINNKLINKLTPTVTSNTVNVAASQKQQSKTFTHLQDSRTSYRNSAYSL